MTLKPGQTYFHVIYTPKCHDVFRGLFYPIIWQSRSALALPGAFYRGCLAEALSVVLPKRFRFADCVSFNSYSSVMYIYTTGVQSFKIEYNIPRVQKFEDFPKSVMFLKCRFHVYFRMVD